MIPLSLLFPKQNFIFQPYICDSCHDVTQKSMSFWIKDCIIHFWGITKGKAVSKIKNVHLSEKSR